MAAPTTAAIGRHSSRDQRMDHLRRCRSEQLVSHRTHGTAVAALLGMVLAILPAALGTPATAAPASSDAIQRFGSCLTAGGQGHLLLMLDTTPSLQTSDPN